MLEVRNLHGGWGATRVVEDMSLTLEAGETLAVIGRNGVGKSTLVELVMGRARQTAGSVRFEHHEVGGLPVHARASLGFALVPQRREVFPGLTVREHLLIAGSRKRRGAWTVDRVLALFPRLGERLGSYGGQLSGGEQQVLAIARALLANPSVLLMDEPCEGLAPVVVESLVTCIRTIAATGSVALLLVEQRVDIALELSQRVLVMDRGRAVFDGASESLVGDSERIAVLMGLHAGNDAA